MKKPTQVIVLLYVLSALSNGVPRGFHLFKTTKNWSGAQMFCRENYLDLATVETEEDWSNIYVILLNNLNSYPWIGMYNDYNSWRWSLDGKYLYQDSNTPFGAWWSFNPSNSPEEYCVEITVGILNDVSCNALKYPVCYNEPASYIVVSIAMNWFAAQSYCRQHYTDLTSVRNQAEKDIIFGKIEFSGLYWIGLSRDGWKWSDKSNVSLIKWGTNEGMNTHGNEFCVKAGRSGFIDNACGQLNPFICRVPVMKIFKVKIQTDSLNLDDAIAQDSLLQNLKKKFEEHGIHQNFTLGWKKQANGKIFNTEE